MSAWAEITLDDVRSRVSADELAAFSETAATDEDGDQEDVLARQIRQVAAFVRRYVFSCRSNYEQARRMTGGLDALGEYTIPRGLLHLALGLMVPVIQGRVGGALLDTAEMRKDERASSLAQLEAIAQCRQLADERWPLLSPEELADLIGVKNNERPRISAPRIRRSMW